MRQIQAKSKRTKSKVSFFTHDRNFSGIDIHSKSKNIPLMTDDSRVKSCFLSCDCSLTKSGLKCWDKVYVSVYCVKARGVGWTSHISCLLKAKGKVLEALLYGREGGLENTLTAFPRPEVPVFWPSKCEVIVSQHLDSDPGRDDLFVFRKHEYNFLKFIWHRCWISFLFWGCAPGHHHPLQLWDNHPCIGLRHHDGWPYLRPKPELHWSQEATKERCHLSTDSVPAKEEQTREMSPEFEERTW